MKRLTLLFVLISSLGYSQVLEMPQVQSINNQTVKHAGFVLSYNETCEQANWVKHMITKDNLANKEWERTNKFLVDPLVKTESASIEDYYKSGYDRGHLAPAADFVHDSTQMAESFLFSNMSPQHPSLNRGMWKRLENFSRTLAKAKDTVFVISGGILDKDLKRIGPNKVCVPKYYYKIIINSDGDILKCFLVENKKLEGDILDYVVPIETIELKTNIEFKLD